MQRLGNDVFAGVNSTSFYPGALFRGVNGGSAWTSVGADFSTVPVSGLLAIDDTLYAGTDAGIFRSTNHGDIWSRISDIPTGRLTATSASGIFATSSLSVYRHARMDTGWTALKTLTGPYYVLSLAVYGSAVFAGTDREGISLSTDHGLSWTNVMTPPFANQVSSLLVGANDLYAGTYYAGVWRRPLSEMVTSVRIPGKMIPGEFALAQNYPNPFNPTTVIGYQVPSVCHVKLIVYDILGRQVATIVNEMKQPGAYDMRFDASGLATGVYFYRMTAGSFAETKKLSVIR